MLRRMGGVGTGVLLFLLFWVNIVGSIICTNSKYNNKVIRSMNYIVYSLRSRKLL